MFIILELMIVNLGKTKKYYLSLDKDMTVESSVLLISDLTVHVTTEPQ